MTHTGAVCSRTKVNCKSKSQLPSQAIFIWISGIPVETGVTTWYDNKSPDHRGCNQYLFTEYYRVGSSYASSRSLWETLSRHCRFILIIKFGVPHHRLEAPDSKPVLPGEAATIVLLVIPMLYIYLTLITRAGSRVSCNTDFTREAWRRKTDLPSPFQLFLVYILSAPISVLSEDLALFGTKLSH